MSTLRLLHTSDWHLGHTLNDWSRHAEHEHFLAWLLNTLEAERVDALLIAGDIFETSNPPAAAVSQWYGFLGQCRARLPKLQVVAIGGNHDSALRLDATNPILRGSGHTIVGGLPRSPSELPDPGAAVVRLHAGGVTAWVSAVPFLRPMDLPVLSEADAAGHDQRLAEAVRRVYADSLATARQRAQGEPGPLLAMGHLYLVGGAPSELSERKLFGGNQHALPADVFPEDVAYVALGHLHRPQTVGGGQTLRYSGAPVLLSTEEARHQQEVVLVDLEAGGVRDVRTKEVERKAQVVRTVDKQDRPLPLADVLNQLKALPSRVGRDEATWSFLDVTVRLDAPAPGLVEQVKAALEGKAARLVRLLKVYAGQGGALGRERGVTSLADLTPEAVFLRRYHDLHRAAPEEGVLSSFREVLALAQDEAGGAS